MLSPNVLQRAVDKVTAFRERARGCRIEASYVDFDEQVPLITEAKQLALLADRLEAITVNSNSVDSDAFLYLYS